MRNRSNFIHGCPWSRGTARTILSIAAAALILVTGSLALAQLAPDPPQAPLSPSALAAPENELRLATTPQVVRYAYDTAGRLIRAEYDDETTISYTYDAAGNLLRRRVVRVVKVYLPMLLKSR